MNMTIRTEQEQDFEAVDQIHIQAFDNREDESKLVNRIRASEAFVPELSIVAEKDNEVVGHLLLSKAVVEDSDTTHTVIVLAPIAVKPEFQKQGTGRLLIEEGMKRCNERGYGLALLIGHPSYYPRLGFQPARTFGLELKQFEVPDEVFMVYEAASGQLGKIKGELKYPQTFFE